MSASKYTKQQGFVALISVIIISLVLIGFTFTVSSAGFFTRFDTLNAEYKRISLGLAESCVNVALLEIAKDPNYAGNQTKTLGAGSCYIKPVTYTAYDANHQKIATIGTQASYPANDGAFSNMNISAKVQDPNVVHVVPTTLVATVSVPAGANLSNFHMILEDATPLISGTQVTVTPSTQHTISITAPGGYTTTGWGGACDSAGKFTPTTGSSSSCYINYIAQPTTAKLTIIANVLPSGPVPVLQIKNNSTNTTSPATSGQPINVPAGTAFTAIATTPSGYQPSPWSGACNAVSGVTGSLTAGQNYVCIINFTRPNTACADTVMIFDRTGSMNPTDLNNEKAAALALMQLYDQAAVHSKVAMGSFGGLDGTSASVPTNGQLTDVYGSGSGTGSLGPNPPTTTGSPSQWTTPANAYLNDTAYATDSTVGHQQVYGRFGFATSTIPGGATITGVETTVYGRTSTPSAQNTGNLAPTGIGNYNNWTGNPSNNNTGKINAVTSADSSYISESVSGDVQTYGVQNASVPTGATINSVTFVASAKRSNNNSVSISLRMEKGNGSGNRSDSVMASLGGTYTNYLYSLNNNPFTGSAWTASEVNNWTTHFGVVKNSGSGTAQVDQLYVVVNYTLPVNGTLDANLSYNNGSNWTNAKTLTLTTTDSSVTLGSPSDTWGRAWSAGDFGDGKFVLRLTNNISGGMVYVNYVTVKIYYTVPVSGLYAAINSIIGSNSGVGTNLEAAVLTANAELNSTRHVPTNQKVMILVSDGEPTKPTGNVTTDTNKAIAAATTAKTGGTIIFTVRYSTDTSAAGISLLRSLASSPANAIVPSTSAGSPPTQTQMETFFTQIATTVCPAAAAAVQANLNLSTYVINNFGQVATSGMFQIGVTGAAATPNSFNGSESGTTINVTPGTSFSIAVTSPPNYYSPSFNGCSASSNLISAGTTLYCSIINYDIPPPPSAPPPPPPVANIGIGTWQEVPVSGP